MPDTIQAPPPKDEFDAWREELLASLRDCGVQRAPRYAVLRYGLAMLAAGLTLFVSMVAGRLMGEGLRGAPAPIWICAFFLYFVFVVAVLSRVRNHFLRSAWQSSARSAEDELRRLGSRRPILYLRSFGLDRRIGRPSWSERYLGTRPFANTEQKLTARLKPIGPVIAIGRPEEKLPALGAARFYVSHERWQEKVEDVRKASQLVLWATGTTEGLKWEINHLIDNLNPRRLVVWAHPHLLGVPARQREEEWSRFRQTLGSVFPQPLPERLGSARFFVFDEKWNPLPVGPRLGDVFTGAQTSALRQALLLQQNGASEAERKALRDAALHREPTDFGSLIGARWGAVNWPLVGLLFVAFTLTPLVEFIFTRIALALQMEVLSSSLGLPWLLFTSLVRTAALVAAFRYVQNSFLAALAAGGAAALALFVFGGPWRAADFSSLVAMAVVPLLRECLLFVCLAWTVRKWSPLATALFGGVFLAGLAMVPINLYFQSVSELVGGFHWELFGMTWEHLAQTFPRWLGAPLMRGLTFAGVYVLGLKLLPVLGLDGAQRPGSF